MTTTKQQTQELINRLADKSLTKGCKLLKRQGQYSAELYEYRGFGTVAHRLQRDDLVTPKWVHNCELKDYEVLGHPILIGDVLQRFFKLKWENSGHWKNTMQKLVQLWWNASGNDMTKPLQDILKTWDKNAQQLFDFLISLGL